MTDDDLSEEGLASVSHLEWELGDCFLLPRGGNRPHLHPSEPPFLLLLLLLVVELTVEYGGGPPC